MHRHQRWQVFTKLDDVIEADDPNKLPVVYDYPSFRVWYNRYKAKNLTKKRKLQRRSRLIAIHDSHAQENVCGES